MYLTVNCKVLTALLFFLAETDTETYTDNSLQNFCTLQNNPSSRNENIINLAVSICFRYFNIHVSSFLTFLEKTIAFL